MPRYASTTTAIEKVCKVLICMTDPGVRRLKDIIERTGIDKASVLRVLDCLQDYALVERDDGTKEYRYGKQLYAMASALPPRMDLAKIAGPSLHRLAKLSGDSVHLLVRDGFESVCIGREVGDWPIRAGTIQIGSRRPLGHGAGSTALIAWLDDAEIDVILAAPAPASGGRKAPAPAAIRREIQDARARGHTLMLDAIVDGLGAVGVPLRDDLGVVIGAIGISSVSPRIAEREALLAAAVRKEAGHVAATMGRLQLSGQPLRRPKGLRHDAEPPP